MAVILATLASLPAQADPAWKLIYRRQIGKHMNANAKRIHNFLFEETGSKAASVSLVSFEHPSTIYPNTDANGYAGYNIPLFNPFDFYDLMVLVEPPATSERSPSFYWQNKTNPGQNFSYATQWLKVADSRSVSTFPAQPVYHYDSVTEFSGVEGFEPPNYQLDEFGLTHSVEAPFQAQAFVVPTGVNRIISAQAHVLVAPGASFQYRASIRSGGPEGDPVGPAVVSRSINHPLSGSPEFLNVGVNWGVEDVPVASGGVYCLRIEPVTGALINAYSTTANVGGADGRIRMYHGGTENAGHDMVAIVVGVGYAPPGPVLKVDPATLAPAPFIRGQVPPAGQFSITNDGGATLNYNVSIDGNPSWLSVDPTSGSSTTETDFIDVTYHTADLVPGSYEAQIIITANGAEGSPSTVQVALEVLYPPFAPCDFDEDGDVDLADFGAFQACVTKSGVDQDDPACAGARLDGDGDVDAEDLGRFNQCLVISGPSVPLAASQTTCAD